MSAPAASQPTVHLVFKTHLDIGFTALAAEVVDRYMTGFIPSALAVAAELRARGGPERFVWTTGSWLVDTFLERADAAGRLRMEAAIEAGDIAWHALPFTMHSELCDPSLFEHGLSIAARLDARFGRRTIAAKMTDVPGHTRGIVPLLAAAGVEFLHIGVNPACAMPDVPPVFRWRSPDGAEIVVAYQAGGYGGAVSLPGLADSLVIAHTDDNRGPQSIEAVETAFGEVRAANSDATVEASTLDAFALALRAVRDGLPVVEAEIGDTWIHGVGTDPSKVGRFRELCRQRRQAIDAGADPAEPEFAAASTSLLLVAEHTWGLDEKIALADDHRYTADDLAALRASEAGRRFEQSWAEQRGYLEPAEALFAARQRDPSPDMVDTSALDDPQVDSSEVPVLKRSTTRAIGVGAAAWGPLTLGGFDVTVDDRTGALVGLRDPVTNHEWAGPDNPLGLFRYQTFDGSDYDRFHSGYNRARPEDEWWALADYTKAGIDVAGAVSAWWVPEKVDLVAVGYTLEVRLQMPAQASSQFGCTPVVRLHWSFVDGAQVTLSLSWLDKPACRLPEASWLSFAPVVDDPDRWVLDKLGQDVSPLDVVARGGRHLHAVGRGVRHHGADATFRLDTLHAPLVAPGAPRLLDPSDDLPDLAGGMHVNLHNNVWGTNFPMWNEGAAVFVFTLSVDASH